MLNKLRIYFFTFISSLLSRYKIIDYKIRFLKDNPVATEISEHTIILVNEDNYIKWLYFKCPCECNDVIMLSMSPNNKPNWDLKIDILGRVSLNPSIWQFQGCNAHFRIIKSRVYWF
jgi:hypothetical protein